MLDLEFKHNDADDSHDKLLTLHDCVAEKVSYVDEILRFYLAEGLWIAPTHRDNDLGKVVKTDSAVVDFRIANIDDIVVRVFTRNRFTRRTKVEIWEMRDLMESVNSGEYKIEFIYQYRTYFEQMWQCAIHSRKKLYYRECQLHLPDTEAAFRWNDLRPDHEW
jgi:hypothetical protein